MQDLSGSWFVTFKKDVSQGPCVKPKFFSLKLPSCGLVVFISMNTYVLTEDTNLKTFLKESYSVGLDSCYIFTKNILNMESKMTLIAFMEFVYVGNFQTS